MITSSVVKTDKETPKDERISGGEFKKYIPQSSTKRFLWTNLPAWTYLQANPSKENWWNSMLRNAGSEPVILDSALTEVGAKNLILYMNSRGFYEATSDFTIKYKKRNKAKVTYIVKQGEPYRINNVNYEFQDTTLKNIVLKNNDNTYLKKGRNFDNDLFNKERKRITDYLRNKGYYDFSQSNISFIADTTIGNHLTDITTIIKRHTVGFDEDGNPLTEDNSIYRIKEVFVNANYSSETELELSDTTFYNGLNIINIDKGKIRPSLLRKSIKIKTDSDYKYSDVQRTYKDILRLNYFNTPRITFYKINAKEEGNQSDYSKKSDNLEFNRANIKDLRCEVLCSPVTRQAFMVNFEATTTSKFYGLRSSINYINRNLFRGAESFHAGISGGYEFYTGASDRKNPYEIGAFASLAFPRFITPFNIDPDNNLFNPQTRIALTYNYQNKPIYTRTLMGASLSYSWSDGNRQSYVFRPLDLSVVDVRNISNEFLQNITQMNPLIRNSYKSQIIPAISISYQYRNPARSTNGNSFTLKINTEIAGNMFYGLSELFSNKSSENISGTNDTQMTHKIFGVPFAQYFRTDFSVSDLINIGDNSAIAYRILGGIGIPYGNSSAMPIDKQFYAGGGISMRGWSAMTLGPGNTPKENMPHIINNKIYPSQTGNMKLEANLEYRFPILGSLRSALFIDVGNIWNISSKKGDDTFQLKSFPTQLGFNTGIGIRYDVGITVIRLDWGIILHDPNNNIGERWINNFKFKNTALSFGVDYPF